MRYQICAQNKVTRKMNKTSSSSVCQWHTATLLKLAVPKSRVLLDCSAQSSQSWSALTLGYKQVFPCTLIALPLPTRPQWCLLLCSVIYGEFWAHTRFVRTELNCARDHLFQEDMLHHSWTWFQELTQHKWTRPWCELCPRMVMPVWVDPKLPEPCRRIQMIKRSLVTKD